MYSEEKLNQKTNQNRKLMKTFLIIVFVVLYLISAVINLQEIRRNKTGDFIGRLLIVILPIVNMLFTLTILSSTVSLVSEEEYYEVKKEPRSKTPKKQNPKPAWRYWKTPTFLWVFFLLKNSNSDVSSQLYIHISYLDVSEEQ